MLEANKVNKNELRLEKKKNKNFVLYDQKFPHSRYCLILCCDLLCVVYYMHVELLGSLLP